MKITHGTAMYTGGGFYSVIGEVDDGNYFVGNTDWCVVIDTDPRCKDEFGEWNFFHIEWLEDHNVHDVDANEMFFMFKDFCERLDANEQDITKGWDKLSNYIPGEATEMINFSEFEALEDKQNQSSLSESDMADAIVKMIKNNSNIEGDDDDSLMITGVDHVWLFKSNIICVNMEDGSMYTIMVYKQ